MQITFNSRELTCQKRNLITNINLKQANAAKLNILVSQLSSYYFGPNCALVFNSNNVSKLLSKTRFDVTLTEIILKGSDVGDSTC